MSILSITLIGHLVSNLAAAAATLDSDSLRKIPREKFRTKINTPRARENVRRTWVVTLVQITAVPG